MGFRSVRAVSEIDFSVFSASLDVFPEPSGYPSGSVFHDLSRRLFGTCVRATSISSSVFVFRPSIRSFRMAQVPHSSAYEFTGILTAYALQLHKANVLRNEF